jgi:hypothetical protein
MPPQEQADLWMALRDRMKTNWHELTLAEKKAGKLSLVLFIFFCVLPKNIVSASIYTLFKRLWSYS